MRRITTDTLVQAERDHAQAVRAYVKTKNEAYQRELFQVVTAVVPAALDYNASKNIGDWSWLENFLLADVATLKKLTEEKPALLQFGQFKKLYKNRFCNGGSHYVDDTSKYNAYTFIENLGVKVCPYCDEEYLDVLEQDGIPTQRTLELDHFFPKSLFPALAMCFYNLVPSGQSCNGIKKERLLGMSPYEKNIEECTRLSPDLPIGINMEHISPEECEIHFHAVGGMQENVSVFCLEQRYLRHKGEAHRYLLLKQTCGEEKIAELVNMGLFSTVEQAREILYGVTDTNQQLLQKLKHDILDRQ